MLLPWEEEQRRFAAVKSTFESVLGSNTPREVFDRRQIAFIDNKRIYEYSSSKSLSEAVLGADFPRVSSPSELDHYTPFDGFRGIINSKSLYLFSLSKRLHQDEFTTFAGDHNLSGYLTTNDTGQPVYRELAEDLFYCSLTKPSNPCPRQLWDQFADHGNGVKIRFRMTPKAADLREMAYKGQKLTALKKINDALMAREGLVYTPWTVSRICAFYLTLGYSNEHEVRLIVKRHEGGLDRRQDCSVHKVWPIPIAPLGCSTGDEFCKVELVDVTAGAGSSSARVRSVLENTPFSGVLVHP